MMVPQFRFIYLAPNHDNRWLKAPERLNANTSKTFALNSDMWCNMYVTMTLVQYICC